MSTKAKQKEIILDILFNLSSARTEIIKIEGMKQGVSCADRYLRWLREEGKVRCETMKGDRTKTWIYIPENERGSRFDFNKPVTQQSIFN